MLVLKLPDVLVLAQYSDSSKTKADAARQVRLTDDYDYVVQFRLPVVAISMISLLLDQNKFVLTSKVSTCLLATCLKLFSLNINFSYKMCTIVKVRPTGVT